MKHFLLSVAIVAACISHSSTAFSQPRVHPAFNALSESQVRSEFAAYEEKGKKCAQEEARGRRCAPITFSPEQPLNVPVQAARGTEFLTFRASISAPRSEVRSLGYQFGKLGRNRTPADRDDVINRLIARMQNNPQAIVFVLRLVSRQDWSTPLPELSFALVNENQEKVWSPSRPDFECPERDILCQVGLSESGVAVTFPLYMAPERVPFVKDSMRMLRLIVTLDNQEEPIDFDLNSLV